MDAERLKLNAEGTGEVENICLRRTVHIYIRHRLPRGVRRHVYNVAALGHVRNGHVGHGGQSPVVKLDYIKLLIHVHVLEYAEKTEACGVHEHTDIRRLGLKHFLQNGEIFTLAEVKGDRAYLSPAFSGKLFEPLLAAGNDPYLVKLKITVYRINKFSSHAGGCAGDKCNFHHNESFQFFLLCMLSRPRRRR